MALAFLIASIAAIIGYLVYNGDENYPVMRHIRINKYNYRMEQLFGDDVWEM